jgi:hypothetical protein
MKAEHLLEGPEDSFSIQQNKITLSYGQEGREFLGRSDSYRFSYG